MAMGRDSVADAYKLSKISSINNLHILIAGKGKIVTGINAAFEAVTHSQI